MEGEQTGYVWGVVDFIPDTDFPDIRNKCNIHSNNGACMIVPREDDKVRLYIQLDSKNATDPSNTRVDKSQMGPHQLFDVGAYFFGNLQESGSHPFYSWNRWHGKHFIPTPFKLQNFLIGGLFILVCRQITQVYFCGL
jgi:FAD binding domain